MPAFCCWLAVRAAVRAGRTLRANILEGAEVEWGGRG